MYLGFERCLLGNSLDFCLSAFGELFINAFNHETGGIDPRISGPLSELATSNLFNLF